jgi:hypothetical protein
MRAVLRAALKPAKPSRHDVQRGFSSNRISDCHKLPNIIQSLQRKEICLSDFATDPSHLAEILSKIDNGDNICLTTAFHKTMHKLKDTDKDHSQLIRASARAIIIEMNPRQQEVSKKQYPDESITSLKLNSADWPTYSIKKTEESPHTETDSAVDSHTQKEKKRQSEQEEKGISSKR